MAFLFTFLIKIIKFNFNSFFNHFFFFLVPAIYVLLNSFLPQWYKQVLLFCVLKLFSFSCKTFLHLELILMLDVKWISNFFLPPICISKCSSTIYWTNLYFSPLSFSFISQVSVYVQVQFGFVRTCSHCASTCLVGWYYIFIYFSREHLLLFALI